MALFEISPDGVKIPIPGDPQYPLGFSYFVPCYNEEKNVVQVIEKLVAAMQIVQDTYEILVFDDGSRDQTLAVARAWQSEHPDVPLRIFSQTVNRGIARNFIEAAFQGRGKYFRVVMGDDVESIETLVAINRLAGQADLIIPYYTAVVGKPAHRMLISRLYTTLVNIASNRTLRYYNGSPLYLRRDALRFHVEASGFGFQAEFLLRLLQEGRSFIEIPVRGSDREGSTSLNFRNFLSVGYSIFKILMRRLGGRPADPPGAGRTL